VTYEAPPLVEETVTYEAPPILGSMSITGAGCYVAVQYQQVLNAVATVTPVTGAVKSSSGHNITGAVVNVKTSASSVVPQTEIVPEAARVMFAVPQIE